MKQFKASTSIIDRNTKSITAYLCEVNKYPLITAEEEVKLARLIRKGGMEGDRAKNKLILSNLRFVVSVANYYKRNDMELSDLISEGNIGLIRAVETFDETRGFKFISYAINWIRQSILTAISNTGDTIRIPQHQQRLMDAYISLSRKMIQNEHRMATAEEFASHTNIAVEDAKQIMQFFYKVVYIDQPVAHDDGSGDTKRIFLSSDSRTDMAMDIESMQHDVNSALTTILPRKECEIIKRSYGIGCEQQSLDTIAMEIGLSRERTRQIRQNGLKRLRSTTNIQILRRYLNAG